MKKLLIATAMLVVFGTLGYGQDVERPIMKMEQEMTDGVVKKDLTSFEKYLADGAVFTDPDGGLMTKTELIAFLKSPDFKMASSVIEGMKVHMFGDTAVVTYITTDKGTIMGKDVSGRNRWTDVWVKMGGKWKMVSEQGTGTTH